MLYPFQPIDESTVAISATTASGRAAILKQPTGKHQLRLANNSATAVRYRVGGSAVAATAASPVLPAGAVEVVSVQNSTNNPQGFVAAITDSGTATLEITTGAGL